MIELSEFYSENGTKSAKIYRDENTFFASVKGETGVYYTTKFQKLEHAEEFAEDWVIKNE